MDINFSDELNVAITVCRTDGTIVYMNQKAQTTFGGNLEGQDVFACHAQASKEKLHGMMQTSSENIYTIEKQGKKKLIYQTPWIENGELKGFVELSLIIPFDMRHINRDK